ncbi:UDP-N-acetylglucosamine 2-epimerase (non-hydrolyzing) [Aggregicoccus sp. 17bor-14]|uniref:non-hydrolyzing UDP-N-acetylglucosamine 2-epimerase n=1 Tax=Myxococcaceae TaxID=31 RepID=UPI00129C87D2|nr:MULTISPECIES: UDP-N-acetylglucosamine 2-epimerase (non-hydrolyzing) [Myxococcaceae]MBF5045083.1 UDP-N-acetylglucosamine 2-epimerase (non-hydrolyzing) [Simulacricoccus sp. 17bor-14]MRI90825.1 UDP-N-acetylglucosamine 2-epimerase (non-hydrolyzing) [Aggregicoccus sp. 17bor-14]
MKKVLHIVGARPNFMKVAPIYKAIAARGLLTQVLVHTGQHYDVKMSDVFFTDLGLPAPHIHLNIGSGSHAEQTARVMMALEKVCLEERPDLVSVVGDVNSTVAAALVTSKLHIPLAHVEAGLRSGDRRMPEEINRLVVDRIADLLLTPSPDGDENLLKEGVEKSRIHFVGNVMIDSLLQSREAALRLPTLSGLGLTAGQYGVCTLHRASNVDDVKTLSGLLGALAFVSHRLPIVFPVHPRTRKMIAEGGLSALLEAAPGLKLVEPLGYLDFLCLTSQARLILTDSGGLQEESTALGVPCLTLRENTERPITVDVGTNLVVGVDPERVKTEALRILDGQGKKGRIPEKWDGKSAERIADIYAGFLGVSAPVPLAAIG